MSKYDDLVKKLKEIFQIDRPELDFGVYRILNCRAGEINDYLENRLKAKVTESLATSGAANMENMQKELHEKEAQYRADGINPDTVPKVLEIREKLAKYGSGAADHENAVFTHLLTFFSRYYDKGDFISQRRYKGDTYAIPYAGEEVVLHWANKDQYYTKSGENFSNYAFKLDDGRTVRFRLVAADTAKDNRKDNDKERRFVLIEPQTRILTDDEGDEYEEELLPVAEENGELVLRFEYKAMPKGSKQEALVIDAVKKVLDDANVKARWLDLSNREPTEKNPQRTLLEKCLSNYTTKNTADYFIHKDLGGFLRRELDFYIKNEVMHLDDVQNAEKFADIEKNLRLIQTLRVIALDLIAFLAQLEDFQKKLWLKKKFVVSTHYCITLDRVPESLYPAIAANSQQWEQWEKLGMLDGSKADLFKQAKAGSVEYLKEHPYLMADTALFDAVFKQALLARVDNLDESLDGLLIHGDNFQALNLLQERYRAKVKCVYIDPPYNTGGDDFSYKDSYRSSSWLAMFYDRLAKSYPFLSSRGLLACHMDEHEHLSLEWLIRQQFGVDGDMGKLVWDKRNPKGDAKGIAAQHEYVHFATNNAQHMKEIDDAFVRNKENAEAIMFKASQLIARSGGLTDQVCKEFREWITKQDFSGGEKAYSLIDENGDVYRPVSMAWPNKKKAPDEYFLPLKHPKVGKDCPIPARGWRNPPKTMESLLRQNLILFGDDETTIPNRKYLLKENLTENVASLYYMGSSDDSFFIDMGIEFENPKPIKAAAYFLSIIARPSDSHILDFFGGSGTTGHATISLNRQDGGHRKYILVEQGEYFDTVMKPRIQKVVYSADWKDGKATAPQTGISHAFKVLKLESYEDTLNNLQLRRTAQQQDLLDTLPPPAQEDYLLRYLLDIESRGSLLSVEQFNKPFDCRLKVAIDSAGAYEERTIDLVETFNYLIGLRVKHIDMQRDQGFVWVTGWLPTGEITLVLWRDVEQVDYENLNRICEKLAINPADSEFEVVYINGDHNIPAVFVSLESEGGIKKELKIRQIEPEFLSRMFSVEVV